MRLAIGKPKLRGPIPGQRVEPQKPTLITQARNLGRAVIRGAYAGFPRRSSEQVADILRICRGDGATPPCDAYRQSDDTCSKCGCPMRRKAWWMMERCPLRKW
jgi:hypothetical protein